MGPNMTGNSTRAAAARTLPAGVLALGMTSLFMDASSELIHSLLPLYMASVLGASMISIGIIEGIAEATAATMKLLSGVVSDHVGKRKWLVVVGYGLAAASKPLFPLATTLGAVFVGRFIDRVGKGIRGAPRDALIADLTPASLRGAAFGLRQALDSVGAFVGPLLAIGFMVWLSNDLRAVLWIATIPAFMAVLILLIAVREPEKADIDSSLRTPLTFAHAGELSLEYWLIVALGAVLTLARFSEAFLILRAHDVGLDITLVPLVMVVMNVLYAATAYPAGGLADRMDQRTLLGIGLLLLVCAHLLLASANSPLLVFAGAAFWGMHMGMTQGLLLKLVADAAPARLRGTAFGVFNVLSAGALLIASVAAGWLWSSFGAAAAFVAGAGVAAIALLGVLLYRALPRDPAD
jgi:MFS family permease